MRLNSIRARMTVAFAASIALLMLCACTGLVWYARQSAIRNAEARLGAAEQKLRYEIQEEHHTSPDFLAEMAWEDFTPEGVVMIVVDPQGHILSRSQSTAPAWPLQQDGKWRVLTRRYGRETFVLATAWRSAERDLRGLTIALLLLGLGVVVAAAAGAWLLVGHTLSPIDRLARQAEAASVDTLRMRLNAPSQDAEMVRLVTTLNRMLTRLSETAAAKGRFQAAASHELRTPLQALSGHLELALQRPRSDSEYRAVVEEASLQTRRLTALARDLLLLNQIELSPLPPLEMVELGDICANVLCTLMGQIEARQLRLEVDLPIEATTYAVPTHIEMLVRNLLENAVKYAAPCGLVQVELKATHTEMRLTIFNECPPIPDWNSEKLFEPFYRPDVSRNSKTGGTGLGLAICKAIADVNGWKLTLQQSSTGVQCEVVLR